MNKLSLCVELDNFQAAFFIAACFFSIFSLSAPSPLRSHCNNVVLKEFKQSFIDIMNDLSKETLITRNNFI